MEDFCKNCFVKPALLLCGGILAIAYMSLCGVLFAFVCSWPFFATQSLGLGFSTNTTNWNVECAPEISTWLITFGFLFWGPYILSGACVILLFILQIIVLIFNINFFLRTYCKSDRCYVGDRCDGKKCESYQAFFTLIIGLVYLITIPAWIAYGGYLVLARPDLNCTQSYGYDTFYGTAIAHFYGLVIVVISSTMLLCVVGPTNKRFQDCITCKRKYRPPKPVHIPVVGGDVGGKSAAKNVIGDSDAGWDTSMSNNNNVLPNVEFQKDIEMVDIPVVTNTASINSNNNITVTESNIENNQVRIEDLNLV
jgi:hypothetical protein